MSDSARTSSAPGNAFRHLTDVQSCLLKHVDSAFTDHTDVERVLDTSSKSGRTIRPANSTLETDSVSDEVGVQSLHDTSSTASLLDRDGALGTDMANFEFFIIALLIGSSSIFNINNCIVGEETKSESSSEY